LEAKLERALRRRLRLMDGQVKGVERMIDEGRDHESVLTQLTAIQSAARAAGELILLDRLIDSVRASLGGAVLQCMEDCPVCSQTDHFAEALNGSEYSTLLAELSRLPLPQIVGTPQMLAIPQVSTGKAPEGGETS
jgi:DNA-binding FrmR family transcriptional regulator